MTTKEAARREYEAARRSLSADEVATKSRQVQRHLAALSFWPQARVVALYAAQSFEVHTEELWPSLPGFCLPRVVPGSKVLTFHCLRHDGGFAAGPLGLRQPPPDAPAVPLDEIDVWVVPGVAFTTSGARIGRGGGYYDATLKLARPSARLVGVTFDCCLAPTLPTESHDVSVQLVITESGLAKPS